MARTWSWSVLWALIAFSAVAFADTGSPNLPARPFPALSAAPLVYALVPNPLGSRTWAEHEVEMIRLGIASEVHEEGTAVTTFVLLSLHTPRVTGEFALETMKPPTDRDPSPSSSVVPVPVAQGAAYDELRLVTALEAMGLTPEDLVEASEMPDYAVALANAIAGLSDLIFRSRSGPREGEKEPEVRVEHEKRYERPDYVRFQKPGINPELPDPHLRLYAKKITRSVYKILLGIAIGVLFWGFVRNTA